MAFKLSAKGHVGFSEVKEKNIPNREKSLANALRGLIKGQSVTLVGLSQEKSSRSFWRGLKARSYNRQGMVTILDFILDVIGSI